VRDKPTNWWKVETDAPDEGAIYAPEERAFAEANAKQLRRKGHKAWVLPIVMVAGHKGPSHALH